MRTQGLASLVPRPCAFAFVACSTKFCAKFCIASDERARPRNEAKALPSGSEAMLHENYLYSEHEWTIHSKYHVMYVNQFIYLFIYLWLYLLFSVKVGGARLSPFLKGPQSSSISFQMGYCLATKCLNSTNTKCNGVGDRNSIIWEVFDQYSYLLFAEQCKIKFFCG